MKDVNDSRPTILTLAPPSKARDILGESFALRETGPAQGVLASGERANDALRAALGGKVSAVALISPPAVEALDADVRERLREVAVPLLALFGMDDARSPIEFGHAWRRALPKGFQSFVYGAGDDMANERPDAVATLVAEFLKLGEGFLVNHDDGRLFD